MTVTSQAEPSRSPQLHSVFIQYPVKLAKTGLNKTHLPGGLPSLQRLGMSVHTLCFNLCAAYLDVTAQLKVYSNLACCFTALKDDMPLCDFSSCEQGQPHLQGGGRKG